MSQRLRARHCGVRSRAGQGGWRLCVAASLLVSENGWGPGFCRPDSSADARDGSWRVTRTSENPGRAMRERLLAFIFLCAFAGCAVAFAGPRQAPHRVSHYEYVAAVGKLYVYKIDKRPSLVRQVALPGVDEIRGIGASAATGMLYVSYGGFPNGTGHLLEFSLYRRKIVYARGYPFGIDSFDISHDGRLIFMPTGENTSGDTWHVLAASTGR